MVEGPPSKVRRAARAFLRGTPVRTDRDPGGIRWDPVGSRLDLENLNEHGIGRDIK